MKNLLIIAIVLIVTFSCGTDQKIVDSMADEMCSAMENVNIDNPKSILDAATALLEIQAKEDLYKEVTLDELENSMKKKCPSGWDNYLLLSDMSTE